MNGNIKQILLYAGIVVFFLVLSYAYVPQVLGGKIVNQADISHWTGMTHEIVQHNADHPDDPTYWTDSMFGGMPSVTMYDKFEGDWTNPLYRFLLLGRRPATYLFIALLGAFLLMLSMGINKLIAVGGAIAVAFCSYNMQIIQVGHNTKMQAIAFFPWVLAALIFTYRSALSSAHGPESGLPGQKNSVLASPSLRCGNAPVGHLSAPVAKTVLGSVLFALALSMQIKANHPQITWYLACMVIMYALGLFMVILCSKEERAARLRRFIGASLLLLVLGVTGIATNANKLIPTWNYSKYTMRGGSELKGEGGENTGGLELGYATAWSYGIGETPNLLIANFNGGASSGALSRNSATAQVLKKYGYRGKELDNTLSSMPLYWGPQPFTAGPMYLGAISIFLFILGMALFKGKEKWWLLAATLFALLLGWGSHMMWFTKLCFNTLPMYNKFRTVSMAIIVLQVSIPLLGFAVLDRIVRNEYDKHELRKGALIAFAITGGFCLLSWLIPGIAGTFSSSYDAQMPEEIARSLAEDRRALLRHDALRSLILIALSFGLIIWAYAAAPSGGRETARKNAFALAGRSRIAATVICVLVLFDMFSMGRRYLNDSHFVTKKDFRGQFEARAVDKQILQDNDPDYRVLDLSVNTFNDAFQSYWHKCVGGYSPAKLQRYQDLIDRYITKEMNSIIKVANDRQTVSGVQENFPQTPVLNMLNTKYVILQDDLPPVENWGRNGNCWFISETAFAGTPDEEIDALGKHDLRNTAVVAAADSGAVAGYVPLYDDQMLKTFFNNEGTDNSEPLTWNLWALRWETNRPEDIIFLDSYRANELRFSYRTTAERLAVFSEIWHPGWVARIYDKNGELLSECTPVRADWVLRAVKVPQGEGDIVMRYEPSDYVLGERVSRASSIVLLLLLLLSGAFFIVRQNSTSRPS